MKINRAALWAILFFASGCTSDNRFRQVSINDPYAYKVDSVLSLMTLEEKIGQLNQYTGNFQATGPVVDDTTKIEQIKMGRVGSMLNIKGVRQTREL
ncbi:hypothetical protein [Alistipes senegalensis]|jgi:beta-glucosidase|uniref:hypothetical protein n=1 Tax=Alistipes senegalensis TaxID=1288121 RepID=UPI002670B030|nr:hypothetical protein [Alistipes senegalensis]